MIVANKSKRILSYNRVQIFPGVTLFNDVDTKKLLEVKDKLKVNKFISLSDEKINSIKELSEDQATGVVGETYNIKLLKSYKKGEDRAKVILAIENQLKLIDEKSKKKEK